MAFRTPSTSTANSLPQNARPGATWPSIRDPTERPLESNPRTIGSLQLTGSFAAYFDTGDLVKLHLGRWVSFVDRVSDTFRWKGENVSTNEVAEDFNPDDLARFVVEQLPSFQRPLFIRVMREEIEVTGTFKHQKVKARNERFDPALVDEPLYYLDQDVYRPIDVAIFREIESGEIRPG